MKAPLRIPVVTELHAHARLSPSAVLEQIREATRTRVVRSQARWRRKARLRRLFLRVETVFLWAIGIAGVALGLAFVVSELYYLIAYFVERAR